MQLCYNAGKCDSLPCRYAKMHISVTPYCAHMLQCMYDAVLCRYATMQVHVILHCYVGHHLAGTSVLNNAEQTVVLCWSIISNRASCSQVRITWSFLVSSTERHFSARKCGTNSRSRTVAHSTSTTLLFYHYLPSANCSQWFFFNDGHPDVLEVSIRKVLRPATSTQVFLGFPVSISKRSDGSQHSQLPLHASHVALRT